MTLLGVDLGTTSVKVGLFAPDGQLLSFARRSYPVDRAGPSGRAEQDPEMWWAGVRDAIREASSDLDVHHTRAVCVGGQGPTLVLVDAEGRPVRPALSWMDTRPTQIDVGLDHRADYSLVPRLAWLARVDAGAVERACWALQAWDFIGARLAGGQVGVASTFAGDEVWPESWLAAAGLSSDRLIPPLIEAGRVYAKTDGPWAAEAGLPYGIPIVGGMNDGIGSILGAAGNALGRATDPGGAAGGLALCWDRQLEAPGVGCWPGLVAGTYIVGGAFAAGGRALDWWASIANQSDLHAALALAEKAPPGAAGLVCLPFLAGERAPIWDSEVRGAFVGLRFEHGGAHFARAVLEGTAYQLRLLAEAIRAAGGRIDELRLCGGPARSRVWNQVKSDVSGLPASVPRLPEVALMGNAICAAVGAGVYPDLITASETMVQVAEQFVPNPAHRAVYDALFEIYKAGYPALKSLRSRSGPRTADP